MTETQQKTRLQPLGHRVLLRRVEAEETLKGGIILPETAKKKQERAYVIALGTGKMAEKGKMMPFPVKEGNVVLFEKYSGQEVTFEDEELIILRAEDIIAVIEE